MTAPTHFNTDDPEAIKKWETRLFVLTMRETAIFNPANGLVRNDENGFIQRKTELYNKDGNNGARATFTLVHDFHGSPAVDNETLHGKEQGLESATDTLDITKIRVAAALDGEVVQQRIHWKIADLHQQKLSRQLRQIMEAGALMHATGFNIDVNVDGNRRIEWYLKGNHRGHTFGHTVRTPDASHMYRVGAHDTDEDVGADSSAYLDVEDFDGLDALGKLLPLPIRPAKVGNGFYKVCILHTDHVKMLRRSETEWWQLMTARIQGGKIDGHPIKGGSMTKPIGEYNGILFFESSYLPPGINSSTNKPVPNTRRFVFGGAQTLLFGLGQRYENENVFKFTKQDWDYEDKRGIAAGILGGMRVPRFNVPLVNEVHDYGRIVGTAFVEDTIPWS